MAETFTLEDFVRESNRIEGIHRDPTWQEIAATKSFLQLEQIAISDLERLVSVYAPKHVIRDRPGLNVRVGRYVAPPGGPDILRQLGKLLTLVNAREIPSFGAHIEYEILHPFTDGNGRSGRALWLWLMEGRAPRGFLHEFYYQTLIVAPYHLRRPSPRGGE